MGQLAAGSCCASACGSALEVEEQGAVDCAEFLLLVAAAVVQSCFTQPAAAVRACPGAASLFFNTQSEVR
jgi:hypothetical protein